VNKTLRNSVWTAVAVAGLATAGAASASAATLNMSGASFPQVAYQNFCASGGECNYAGGGSGTGIRNLVNGVNTLVGSDAPLTDVQQGQLGAAPVYVPTLLGAISVPVNVSGVTGNRLKLTGKQVGDIFSGSITNWKQLKNGVNAKQPLPNAAITVCVRSDGSGTSFGFSRYLGKVSPNFLTKVGGGGSQTPPWTAPSLLKAPQNPGVANCIKSTANSIGYVDLADALRAGLGSNVTAIGASRVVKVGKRTKRVTQYVLPSTKTISAAGDIPAAKIKKDLTIDFSASPVPGSYPIVVTTWLVGSTNSKNKSQVGDAQRVANFFLASGQQAKLAGLGFAPLPAVVLTAAKKNIANIQ
jgi:phosphate transport system substrate-binding protein